MAQTPSFINRLGVGIMTEDKAEAILISETHWDRAWYLTFQKFRLKLVGLMDQLFRVLESDPEFRTFTFDGQTVVLEDYLEMVPYQRDRLRDFVIKERIDVGPWYVLPDVFLVSGEALIRNLLLGRRIAKEFGRVMEVGYIPDPFGHVSQLPMILSQFRYDSVIFARGAGNEMQELGAEFIWEASDGSEVLAHWLPMSYFNVARLPEDIQDAVKAVESAVEQLRPWSRIETLLLMNGSDHLLPQPHVPKVIQTYNDKHDKKIVFGTLTMFVERLRENRSRLKRYRGEFRGSKYQNLLSGVYSSRVYLKQMNEYTQRLLERAVEPWCSVAHILGAKYPDDEIRMAWKYLLRNHPHDDICGCSIDEAHDDMVQRFRWVSEISDSLLEKAHSTLSQEHARDSPGIVVSNPLPRERSDIVIFELPASDFRFARLAEVQVSNTDLVPKTPLEAAKNEIHIQFVLGQGFNPSPSAAREIVIGSKTLTEFEFDFSALALLFPEVRDRLPHLSTAYRIRVNSANKIVEVWARKYYALESMKGIPLLADEEGKSTPIQVLDLQLRKDEKARLIADREEFLSLAIQVDKVGGLGTKRFDIAGVSEDLITDVKGAVVSGNDSIENNFVRVKVESNGTIILSDKRTDEVYSGLLEFEDSADVGDEYDYSPIREPLSIRSDKLEVTIETGQEGPLMGSILISGDFELPLSATAGYQKRSDESVQCEFTTEITLYADSPTLHVVTEFNNLAEDHRLRILLPTGTHSKTVLADTTFDLVERPVRPKVDDSEWYQPAAPTYPLRRFVSLKSTKRGLMVCTKGLLEFEVLEEQGGTIALTLLRSVGWLARTGLKTRKDAAGPILETPGGQCLGLHTFEYAITPHDETVSGEEMVSKAESFLLPMTCHLVLPDREGSGSYEKSFLSIEPDCIELSAFKLTEDRQRLAVRLWNSSESRQMCTVRLGFNVAGVAPATADENTTDDEKVTLEDERTIRAHIAPRGLQTILLELKPLATQQ